MHTETTLPACAHDHGPAIQDNPIRGRVNAAFFHLMDWYMHWKYASRKSALFGELPSHPALAVREILRVLRPGGRFLCIEHVAAPADSTVGFLQRLVHRPWRWFFEGCHTHRDTAGLLRRAGFSHVEVREFTWRSAFVPVRPQIEAECVK